MTKRRYAFYEVSDQGERLWPPGMTFLTRVMNAFHTIRQERYSDGVLFGVEEQALVLNPWGFMNRDHEGAPRYVHVVLPIGFDIAEYEQDLAARAVEQGIGFARCGDGILDLPSGEWEGCAPAPSDQPNP